MERFDRNPKNGQLHPFLEAATRTLPPASFVIRIKSYAIDAEFDAAVTLLLMNLILAHIGPRPNSRDDIDALAAVYLGRCSAFARCRTEAFRSEEAMLGWLDGLRGAHPL